MSVVRINKTQNYTVMSNYHLRDQNLSLKAKGLLSMMLSLPEDWDYSVSGLCTICKEGETAIKAALSELKDFGYLLVTKKYPNETSSGKIEYVYDIYEHPQNTGNQDIENLNVENQGQINKEYKIKNTNNNSAPEPHECDCSDEVIEKANDICRKDLRLNENSTSQVIKVIRYYFDKYRQHTGQNHPNISRNVLYRIIELLMCPSDECDDLIKQEAYEELIDRHFITDYGKSIDYRLPHFATQGIIEYQARNTGYFSGFKECDK